MHNNIIMSDKISKTIYITMYITVLQTLIAYFVVRGSSSSICLSICLCFTISVDILNNSANRVFDLLDSTSSGISRILVC